MADSAVGDRNGNDNIKISKHHKQLLKDKIGSLISTSLMYALVVLS